MINETIFRGRMASEFSHEELEFIQRFQRLVKPISDDEYFLKQHGFTLKDYLNNRKQFSFICKEHAAHMEKFSKDAGIAKTVGGSVAVVSGGLAVLGLILSPFTVGASLGLTISGITGSILGSGTTIGATIAKDVNIQSDQKKIKEALEAIDSQEKVVVKLIVEINDSLKKMKSIMEKGVWLQALGAARGGVGLIFKGVDLGKTIAKTVRIATTVSSIADDAAVISVETAGKVGVAAGSTTLKVFSGIFAGVGIVLAAHDIYKGVKDIQGSEIAEKFQKFAREYDEETESIRNFIQLIRSCG